MSSDPGPVAKAQMLIRTAPEAVFEALVDPGITSRFWFSHGSGRLEPGARVRWEWEMYGVGSDVTVLEIESARRILVEWDAERPTKVEWTLEPRGEGRTFVTARNWGFHGAPDEKVAAALDSTGGFSFLLAALKAWLEHGVVLDLVVDHAPDALAAGWSPRRA